jgi:opacity protein-like surface antigen
MHLKSLFVAALVSLSAPAAAQLSWYGGLSAGQSRTDHELVANRESTLVFAQDVRTDFDDKGDAWKAFGGVRFGRHFGLEATYADLGKHRMETTLLGGDPPLPAAIIIDRRISGFGLDAVLMLPLVDDRLDLFAKAGVFRARLKAQASLDGNIEFSGGTGERTRSTRRSEDVSHVALGLQYWFTPRVALRAEWERYASIGKPFEVGGSGTTGQADTDVAWLGVVARF